MCMYIYICFLTKSSICLLKEFFVFLEYESFVSFMCCGTIFYCRHKLLGALGVSVRFFTVPPRPEERPNS